MSLPENPENRLEQYLQKIAGGSGSVPEAASNRLEQYLQKIAGGSGSVPEVASNRLEQYLQKIAGGSGSVPEVASNRLEQYLQKIAGGSGSVPELASNRLEQYLDYIAEHSGSRLPSEYQEVTYIKSDGQAYIDTGHVIDELGDFHIKGSGLRTGLKKNTLNVWVLCGAPFKYSVGANLVPGMESASYRVDFGLCLTGSAWPNVVLDSGTKGTFRTNTFDIAVIDKKLYYNDKFISDLESLTHTPHAGSQKIFGVSSPVTGISVEIYEDSKCQMVPCYKKSDGVIGMYDTKGTICPLTGTPFYINAAESGSFSKGADVE